MFLKSVYVLTYLFAQNKYYWHAKCLQAHRTKSKRPYMSIVGRNVAKQVESVVDLHAVVVCVCNVTRLGLQHKLRHRKHWRVDGQQECRFHRHTVQSLTVASMIWKPANRQPASLHINTETGVDQTWRAWTGGDPLEVITFWWRWSGSANGFRIT